MRERARACPWLPVWLPDLRPASRFPAQRDPRSRRTRHGLNVRHISGKLCTSCAHLLVFASQGPEFSAQVFDRLILPVGAGGPVAGFGFDCDGEVIRAAFVVFIGDNESLPVRECGLKFYKKAAEAAFCYTIDL